MGSGKGQPEGWVAVVKPGRMLFEMSGVTPDVAKEAMRLAAHKLPIRTRFVVREEPGADGGRAPRRRSPRDSARRRPRHPARAHQRGARSAPSGAAWPALPGAPA